MKEYVPEYIIRKNIGMKDVHEEDVQEKRMCSNILVDNL